MKQLSLDRLADMVKSRRKALALTQLQLSDMTGINRALLSRMESKAYTPSIDQLLALSDVLQCDVNDVWKKTEAKKI